MLSKALLVIALASGSAQPQQFDLVCNGTMAFSASDAPAEHSWHLRLDLATKQYCDGDCFATRPIADVQPNVIVIEPELHGYSSMRIHHIDRTNGEYVYFNTTDGHWIDAKASCAPAPFTGFPKLQTKF